MKIIVFEGIDCTGKSTMVNEMFEFIQRDYEENVIKTNQPFNYFETKNTTYRPDSPHTETICRKSIDTQTNTVSRLLYFIADHIFQSYKLNEYNENSIILTDRYYHSRCCYQASQLPSYIKDVDTLQEAQEFIYNLHTCEFECINQERFSEFVDTGERLLSHTNQIPKLSKYFVGLGKHYENRDELSILSADLLRGVNTFSGSSDRISVVADAVLYYKCSPDIVMERLQDRNSQTDQMEKLDFLRESSEAYDQLFSSNWLQETVYEIDAEQDLNSVSTSTKKAIQSIVK